MPLLKDANVKPFQVILLLVFGGLAVIGLYLFASFAGFNNARTSVGAVEVWGTLPQAAVDGAFTALKNADQDFTGLTYREIPEGEFDRVFTEALATGQGPDLVILSQERLVGERAKLSVIPYSSISERDYRDAYVPVTELFLAEDGTYGIPVAIDPMVLYYNRTLLSQAGIATPPQTWEAVLAYVEPLTRRQGGAIAQSAVPFGSYQNNQNARAILSLLFLQSGSSITAVTTSGIRGQLSTGADTVSGVVPASAALSFYTQFADPAKSVYTWNPALPDARQAFIAGDLAFYPGFASELPQIRSANPNLDFDMAAIPQPQNAQLRTTYGKAYALAVPRSADNPANSLRAAFAVADPSVAPIAARALSMAPALRTELGSGTDRYQPIYDAAALVARGWLSPEPVATDRVFGAMIGNIMSGRVSISQALIDADRALGVELAN